jgi:hypothetical protein
MTPVSPLFYSLNSKDENASKRAAPDPLKCLHTIAINDFCQPVLSHEVVIILKIYTFLV